ncbi:MAG: type II toxin-antitoxin system HicB family antitoxin [Candidatus Binataceae bacterium]
MRYAIVIEHGEHNLSAYVPDLPRCVATGGTVDELTKNMAEAIEFHIDGLGGRGEAVPEPTSLVEYVEVKPGA